MGTAHIYYYSFHLGKFLKDIHFHRQPLKGMKGRKQTELLSSSGYLVPF